MLSTSLVEAGLNRQLLLQPHDFKCRYSDAADRHLRELLFCSLACQRDDYLRLFFPNGPPSDNSTAWSLRTAQGAVDGAEYTAGARGRPCGHIFKSGESTYHCKTCAADDTCVLCARCFDSSNHEGHIVFISVSPGNSGCCDCGDQEAWRREVRCSLHFVDEHVKQEQANSKDKARATVEPFGDSLPHELVETMRMTISRVINYLCDVFSCSPEQMRLQKTEHWIRQNEVFSRLSPAVYGHEPVEDQPEFVLVLWNDEKHTIDDVKNQVARACSTTKSFGYQKALEVNDVGRSCVHFSRNVPDLVRMAEIIEQLKVTVTIRSARDTFREQMCATMIDWIADIAGCAVGSDTQILRQIICEELLKPWRPGSEAINKNIGQAGIDDHEEEEGIKTRRRLAAMANPTAVLPRRVARVEIEIEDDGIDDDEEDGEEVDDDNPEGDDDEDYYDEMDVEGQVVESVAAPVAGPPTEMDIDYYVDDHEEVAGMLEATFAGYNPPPPPPPPPQVPQSSRRRQLATPAESEDGDERGRVSSDAPFGYVPRTPRTKAAKRLWRPSKHWLERPEAYRAPKSGEPYEDLWQRIRLDLLILYDLRLWKTLRVNLRHLYITTVVTIPHFKRILGLRFAALYTALAQLYLIADREPDHSIINLSVQMLTTPTITQEVVERGNFLTNLMAILYTFLTTRQVGFPEDINPKATLAFDAGAVTNRRMFHFFLDLRWLCQSEFIQYHVRVEPRYLLQFIDLVKLHQGVCPNIRAIGAHIEYEPDTWISASMIVKEINKLCKQIAVSFERNETIDPENVHLQRAIRTVAQVVMINSFGYERKRFALAEAKKDMAWHTVGPFEAGGRQYSVPNHLVQSEPTSFHHPLHYLLSWLLENGNVIDRDAMRALLNFSLADLKDPWNASRNPHPPSNLTNDELLSSIFEHPLRLCVWLSQMKAGMWVRNGVTLRHQAHSYRSVSNRDVAYQRDIFMVQAGLVICGDANELTGERFLAHIVDRFQMTRWITGDYSVPQGFDEIQQIDVIEDFFHLLIVALSERGNLIPVANEREHHERILRHDIAHTLCFKPLSFSDLAGRVTEKVGESDDFNRVLELMTNYRPPEGLTDSGTFELKPDFVELVDPYYAHYSRNHREEAEALHKKHMARKTGKKIEDVVYEPRLEPIRTGLFKDLAAFTRTPLFAQVIYSALTFAVDAQAHAPKLQPTRIEAFLHMVLHLVTLAALEDRVESGQLSFVSLAVDTPGQLILENQSIVQRLVSALKSDEFSACHASIKNILQKMQRRQPQQILEVLEGLQASLGRADTGSPASFSTEDKEKRKQEALARQARIMAQMKQQQNSFLQNQGLAGFEDDLDDFDDMSVTEDTADPVAPVKTWSFPSGTCILCQEETDDQRLYGTFAYIGQSHILRSTPVEDESYIKEVLETPTSLDRSVTRNASAKATEPNIPAVEVPTSHSFKADEGDRSRLGRGFPHDREQTSGPVATGCGHIMHFNCFELYLAATARRHSQQIARDHPERMEHKEFICPLCKALGNTFLPIVWKAKQCTQDHELHAAKAFADWQADRVLQSMSSDTVPSKSSLPLPAHIQEEYTTRLSQYIGDNFTTSLAVGLQELSVDNLSRSTSDSRPTSRRGFSLSMLFRAGHGGSQSSIENHGLSPTGSEAPQRVAELMRAYARIGETIQANELSPSSQTGVGTTGTLSRALGFSVAAYEIAHRGVGDDHSARSLLNELSEQNLTHLRILSETVESYQALETMRPVGFQAMPRQATQQREIMTMLLFGSDVETSAASVHDVDGRILFQDDIFLFFVDWLSFVAPRVNDALHLLQLCLWAEIVKAIWVLRDGLLQAGEHDEPVDNALVSEAFKHAANSLAWYDTREAGPGAQFSEDQLSMLRQLVDRYANAFLRKAIIVMHVRYGLDFDCPYDLSVKKPEQERLTALLHLVNLDDFCNLYNGPTAAGEKLRRMALQWIRQADMIAAYEAPDVPPSIVLPHPAIFQLVRLPLRYDSLTEEAIRRRCPTTGKEICDPAVCLFCGDIFCSQAVCCMVDRNKGGCYQHMQKCGITVGMFIIIRKCMVVFLHGPGNGCFAHAPYLDRHGEPDPALRRHHQLFLNQRRYDKLLRDIWLSHMIPTVISRKLEGDINPGGWETL